MRATADEPTAIPHVPALDGLRGIAILLVLALHFGVGADLPARTGLVLAFWIERVLYVGWVGVDLFFVLSGFLITRILLASRNQPAYFKRFYARRALRIFPLYYLAVVLAFVAVPHVSGTIIPSHFNAPEGAIWFWTYTLNLALVFGAKVQADLVIHFWTLAIEEQYYFIWPSIVRRASEQMLIRICIGLIGGALALRIAWISAGWEWEGAYHFTLTRVDAFGVGGLIAVLAQDSRWWSSLEKTAHIALAAVGTALFVMFLTVSRFYPSEWPVVTFGHSLVAIAFGCMTVLGLSKTAPPWLLHPALRTLGKYSYGTYVWHWPIQRLMLVAYASTAPADRLQGALQALAFVGVGIAGSLACGCASYYLVETPFLRLKRLFAYSNQLPEPTAEPSDVDRSHENWR
jgi:peptidoglycan/LPS O-acetylase OafA/YrhL